ncbi:MAG: hypothetical protein CW338_09070 [Clostridiales bacterium]|nr:hypothetical protein [Clostridiales bacterium]
MTKSGDYIKDPVDNMQEYSQSEESKDSSLSLQEKETNNPEKKIQSSEQKTPDSYSMQWHKFLMVMFIISAIWWVITGVFALIGIVFRQKLLYWSAVYVTYPALKPCNIIYGICSICLGIILLLTRNNLHAFRRNALQTLMMYYVLCFITEVFYIHAAALAVHRHLFTVLDLSHTVRFVVLALINYFYYKHRRKLFVN